MTIKETVPFNFDDIYAKITEMFEARGYDSIYEGSNTAQLITAMSYLTSMLNTNTAVNINEMLLTTATKRDNVYHDAKLLGYEPAYIKSYQYTLTLEFEDGVHVIPKFSQFSSGGKTFYYMGEDIQLNTVTNPTGNLVEITVKEGTLHTYDVNPDTLNYTIVAMPGTSTPQHYIDIPYSNVEEDGLTVLLTYIDEFNQQISNELWTRSEQFMIDSDSELKKQYVRLDNVKFRTPRIYFKLAGVGTGLRLNTIVKINVLESSGSAGTASGDFTTSLDCTVIDSDVSITGEDEESIDSVKENAPLFFNSGNRAVTKIDYVSICNRQQIVKETEAWGGDDEYPQIPGHIWFSFNKKVLNRNIVSQNLQNTAYSLNPGMVFEDYLNNYYLTGERINDGYTADTHDGEIGELFKDLNNYKIPTLIFHNRHPIYVDFDVNVKILRYDLGSTKPTVNNNVFNVINKYFYNIGFEHVETFGFEFFKSNLIKRIDIELSDVTGIELEVLTSTKLNNKTIVYEDDNLNNGKIIIPLGVPFENYFPNDVLDASLLPDLSGTDVFNGKTLSVDWSLIEGLSKTETIIVTDILVDGVISGKYTLFNSFRKYIVVELFVKSSTGSDGVYLASNILDTTVINEKINIAYKTTNIQFIKNSIPRLNTVNFLG